MTRGRGFVLMRWDVRIGLGGGRLGEVILLERRAGRAFLMDFFGALGCLCVLRRGTSFLDLEVREGLCGKARAACAWFGLVRYDF